MNKNVVCVVLGDIAFDSVWSKGSKMLYKFIHKFSFVFFFLFIFLSIFILGNINPFAFVVFQKRKEEKKVVPLGVFILHHFDCILIHHIEQFLFSEMNEIIFKRNKIFFKFELLPYSRDLCNINNCLIYTTET